jgi:hypothetical protein
LGVVASALLVAACGSTDSGSGAGGATAGGAGAGGLACCAGAGGTSGASGAGGLGGAGTGGAGMGGSAGSAGNGGQSGGAGTPACGGMPGAGGAGDDALFAAAAVSAIKATDGFERSLRFVKGWDQWRDKKTGLYWQNLNSPLWTPENSAADLWPFMVLTTFYTDKALFEGQMRETLKNEIALTSRVGVLPDDYDLTTYAFVTPAPVMPDVIFGAAEYIKDGLTPIAELLNDKPYFDRMTSIATAICAGASIPTAKGPIPSASVEVNGDILLTMTRLYAATGDMAYLDCARKIAEYYLFESPIVESTSYQLRDHGGEITAGLVETFIGLKMIGVDVTTHRVALKKLLDRVLAVGRNADGFFYNNVDLVSGNVNNAGLADTWGYVYDGFYAWHLSEGEDSYRKEVVRTLGNLPKYENYAWEGTSADGYADSIESAINLLNREPVPEGLDWVESQIQVMFAKQGADGVIEAWHGDGNFARTALMYSLMHTRGTHVEPWRQDVRAGAVASGDALYVSITADAPWSGVVCFDEPRSATHLHLPYDYPRLNQFPEWFTAKAGTKYEVTSSISGKKETLDGSALVACRPVKLDCSPLVEHLQVRPVP